MRKLVWVNESSTAYDSEMAIYRLEVAFISPTHEHGRSHVGGLPVTTRPLRDGRHHIDCPRTVEPMADVR